MFTVLIALSCIFGLMAFIGSCCLIDNPDPNMFTKGTPIYILLAFFSLLIGSDIHYDEDKEQLIKSNFELEVLKTTGERRIMDAINDRLLCDTIAVGSNGDVLAIEVDSTVYLDKFVKQKFRFE